jgi:transcriptional adapter 3
MPPNTPYLNTPTSALVSSEPSIEALIEKACLKVAKPGDPPGSRELQLLQNKIQRGVSELMSKRGEISDRAMRQQVQKRKERIQIEQQNEATRAEEERIRIKREDDERRKEKKAANKKRSHDDMELDGDEKERKDLKDSLPSVGAHGLARQDGVGLSDGKYTSLTAPPQSVLASCMNFRCIAVLNIGSRLPWCDQDMFTNADISYQTPKHRHHHL